MSTNGGFVESKIVCFIGHRNVKLEKDKLEKLKTIIENLITNDNFQIFLFGSRSEFDYICHSIVTELKEKYPFIQRKCYTCKSESCILESERVYWEKVYSSIYKKEVHLLGVEKEVEFNNKWTAGKASYVERNQAMINDSDICIFYYNENYKPQKRKYSKRSFSMYQPKSGTALAYNYAKQKKKQIINVFKILE